MMRKAAWPGSALVLGLLLAATPVSASGAPGVSMKSAGRTAHQAPFDGAESQRLGRLLALAAEYCARLSRSSIDFVCLEDITEKIQERNPVYPTSAFGRPGWRNDIVTHRYLYDYQFVVESGRKTEKRRMLEHDGIKKDKEVIGLDTLSFFYKNVLFGAVDLLDASRQGFYRYSLEGR
ncbi:MAG: hypothetical protein JW775_05270, partial [Candidatus Aminicenantes bacterium]|nr:hypothetical protein [Candidatus Aminicenantes bacterium]